MEYFTHLNAYSRREIFFFALLGTLLLCGTGIRCTLLDLFTRKLEIKTSARTDCTTFEGVGFIEQNGYDSLYGILTDGLTIENMILNYSVMGDGGAKRLQIGILPPGLQACNAYFYS